MLRNKVNSIIEGLGKEKVKTMEDAEEYVKKMLKVNKILGCSMDIDGFTVTVKFNGQVCNFRVGKNGTLSGGI